MKAQRSGSMPCGKLFCWIRREKVQLRLPSTIWVREKKFAQQNQARKKWISRANCRVVRYRALGLISKDNRPWVQVGGWRKPQLIVVQFRSIHYLIGYYRSIPPELPRTTRILRATAL